jgi:hypothetical protein
MWAAIASTLLGIWLMAAPSVIGLEGAARTNAHVVGPLLATFAGIAISQVTRSFRRLNALLGVWLIIAPVLLGHGSTWAAAHSVAVGIAALALSLISGKSRHQQGGGWRALPLE